MNHSDTSSTCSAYCPKPKKSKTGADESCDEKQLVSTTSPPQQPPQWALLPSIVLYDIFDLLAPKDRQNASAVCKNWRSILFHPKWWPVVTIKLEPCMSEKSRFFITAFGKTSSSLRIKVNTLHSDCAQQFLHLLDILRDNNNLKALIIEATHCQLHTPPQSDLNHVIDTLKSSTSKLQQFSIGCIEELSLYLDEYLSVMSRNKPENVTLLGLASVKDNPNEYEASYFDCNLMKPFVSLRILSIDYDHLSDDLLGLMNDSCKRLQRLVVHLHGVRTGHPGTSNQLWQEFRAVHPDCELRLSVIHSYEEIMTLHETVLRQQMPLSHLKVFFTECVNMAVLEFLYEHYSCTLRSLVWVDSLTDSKRAWSFLASPYDTSPDPIIMISWLCRRLEELVLYGYKFCEENLIAIARLRGDQLKNLEIAEVDCIFRNEYDTTSINVLMDVQLQLKRFWSPTKLCDLHPVVRDPTAGDSDEYLLPLVLADLH